MNMNTKNEPGPTDPSTWGISIRSSHDRGNAPAGYLIVHVELVPGILFAQCERNPFTRGKWRYISFHWGDAASTTPGDCLGSTCVDDLANGSIARDVFELLEQVSAWFDDTHLVLNLSRSA
jgi:hypothetical protein